MFVAPEQRGVALGGSEPSSILRASVRNASNGMTVALFVARQRRMHST